MPTSLRRLVPLATGTAVATALACAPPAHRIEPIEAMGREGFVELYLGDEQALDDAFREVRETIGRIERMTDPDVEDGALGRLNREAGEAYHTVEDRDFYRCMRLAMDYARVSRGAFDPTVGPLARLYENGQPDDETLRRALPSVGWQFVAEAQEANAFRFRRPGMELDLGGVRKGYALHVASRALARVGSRAGLFVLGANAYAWGAPPGERFWTVPMVDPRHPGRPLWTVEVSHRGVAVSAPRLAGRETLFDPKTGRPASGEVLLAMGIAHTGGDADAFATAMAASSYDAATDLIGRMRNIEAALLVRQGGRTYLLASASLRDRLVLSAELNAEIDGDVRFLLPPEEYPDGPA